MTETITHIHITEQPEEPILRLLEEKNYSTILVLADTNTLAHCYPLIKTWLPRHQILTVPPGEAMKILETCSTIWQAMTEWGLDRKSVLINLGGGVIGDMGGFCAATYKRGIDFINLPTTLLAQVDASIGGKLGIDFQQFKNHIGLFRVPTKVVINPKFLDTVPRNELRSGYAEVVKHALIADAPQWEKLIVHPWHQHSWKEIVAHSITIKTNITGQDPEESGLRKILNYGHTIGHAVESHFLKSTTPLLHGEAIAIGMIAEAHLSEEKTGLKAVEKQQLVHHLTAVFGKVNLESDDIENISEHISQDKKNEGGKVLASLLEGIGQATYNVAITQEEVKEALQYYQQIQLD